MEDENNPLYFYQFIEKIKQYELRHVSDVKFPLTASVVENPLLAGLFAQKVPDKLTVEQYLDFLHYRSFRCSLLTYQKNESSDYLLAERVKGLNVASVVFPVNPVSQETVHGAKQTASFYIDSRQSNKQELFTTDQPLEKGMFTCLAAAWPGIISFKELAEQILIAEMREVVPTAVEAALSRLLIESYSQGLYDLYLQRPAFKTTPGDQPQVSVLTLYQAQQSPLVTNPLHEENE